MSGVSEYWSIPEEVDPDWAGRRAFAGELRRLASEVLVAEGADWAAAVDSLKGVVLPSGRSSAEAWADRSYHQKPARFTDRGAMMGRCNVVAPPMKPSFSEGRSTCAITLDERYVGAPGMTHGGLVAAIFDQICGYCLVMLDVGALTTELTVRYRAPVPLHREVTFSAWLEGREGRVVRVASDCRRDGTVLAECSAVFVTLKPDQVNELMARF